MKACTTKTFTTILLALVVAAIAVPGAAARPSQQVALPGSLAQIQHPGSVSDFDTYDFVQPTGVYETPSRETTSAGTGFAWSAAMVGGAFVLGLCLVSAGAGMVVRARTVAASSGHIGVA
jgi:hypothetical protein